MLFFHVIFFFPFNGKVVIQIIENLENKVTKYTKVNELILKLNVFVIQKDMNKCNK